MVVAQVALGQLVGPVPELLDLCHRLVQWLRRRHDGREHPEPPAWPVVQMDNELDAVLEVVSHFADLPYPGPHHHVPDTLFIGAGEEGVDHLELQRDEHQATLRSLPQQCLLVDRRLGTGQRTLHHRLGQPNHHLRHS